MKFLGSIVGSISGPNAMFAEILSKLTTKLKNIDRSTLRGEFKLNIYTRYALLVVSSPDERNISNNGSESKSME